MLLFLRSKDQILAARERLTEFGVGYQLISRENGSPILQISALPSIFSPATLAQKLGDLGQVEFTASRTPLLDSLGSGHEVVVEVKGRHEPLRFKNFSRRAVWI